MASLLANPLLLAVALLAAAAMGFSIQQGGTCMVAATTQLIEDGSSKKLRALAECSLWTSALGLAALALGLPFRASPGFAVAAVTVLGGTLLGLGAVLNGACVFGSIARIGGRDWHYLLTPPGYFLGSLIHAAVHGPTAASASSGTGAGLVPILVMLMLASLAVSIRQFVFLRRLDWDYRHATIAIGLTFVPLAVLAGPWTYTEALSRAAHGGEMVPLVEAMLFAALLGGAILGGRGLAGPDRVYPARALTCLGGGVLMGLGASMIPGGNDNLILVGLPGLQPHAWIAIAAMTATIAFGLLASRGFRRLRGARARPA